MGTLNDGTSLNGSKGLILPVDNTSSSNSADTPTAGADESKGQKGKPKGRKNGSGANEQQIGLGEAIANKKELEALARKHDNQRAVIATLLNPLAETERFPAPPFSVQGEEASAKFQRTSRLCALYPRLLMGETNPPAVYTMILQAPFGLALLSNGAPHPAQAVKAFKFDLANTRLAENSPTISANDSISRELNIWGVAFPAATQTQGYLSACASIGEQGKDIKTKAVLAAIKVNGVRVLSGFITRVGERLHGWTPQGVWNSQKTSQEASCHEASNVWMQSVRHLISAGQEELAQNLGKIAWNALKLSYTADQLENNSIGKMRLAGDILKCAVANCVKGRGLSEPKPNDFIFAVNQSSSQKTKSEEAILSPKKDGQRYNDVYSEAHKGFLATLIKEVCSKTSTRETAIQTALATLLPTYSKVDILNLIAVEKSLKLSQGPTQIKEPAQVETALEPFLEDILRSYCTACDSNVVWRLAQMKDGEYEVLRTGSLSNEEIARLTELSVILAGVPRHLVEKFANS